MKSEKRAGLGLVLMLAGGVVLGCGGDSLPQTLGDVCSRLGAATCDRAVACMLATAAERPQCLTDFQDSCCTTDGTCGDKPTSPAVQQQAQTFITACSNALKTFDCAQLEAGNVPNECSNPP